MTPALKRLGYRDEVNVTLAKVLDQHRLGLFLAGLIEGNQFAVRGRA